MEAVSDPDGTEEFDYAVQEDEFRRTFAVLRAAMGGYAFAWPKAHRMEWSRTCDDLVWAFGIYHFEAFTLGIQGVLGRIDIDDEDAVENLKALILRIKCDPAFGVLTRGGGKNSLGQLAERIEFVRARLEDEL
jgi:hypothetical protein